MSTQVLPKKNAAFTFYVGLVDQADTKLFKSNPTLAAGDVQVSIDGAALGNLATLPDVDPNSSKLVKVDLSAAEMNGDNIQVIFSDAAGAEWCDLIVNIQTTALHIDDQYIRTGTAQAGAAQTITLDAGASAVDDFYNGTVILIVAGTGAQQARVITDYDGTTKVATVAVVWATNPASDSEFAILASGASVVDANIVQIEGSTSAVDNLLDSLDGTGFNIGGGAITVAGVTGILSDLDSIIPDSVPAVGSRPSIRQALYMIVQILCNRDVAAATLTVRKVDGSTGLMTFTLNDGTNPTSIVRAS